MLTATQLDMFLVDKLDSLHDTVYTEIPIYAYAQTQTDDPFLTTWVTTGINQKIRIPVDIHSGGILTIDWGDGDTTTVNSNGQVTHTYTTPASYRVTMTGDLSRINLDGSGSTPTLLHSINQWGDIQWSTMKNAFRGASQMTYHATDAPDLSQVTDMSGMFRYASQFNGDLSNWNTSSVTNMFEMFYFAGEFNGDLSNWDTSSVTNMFEMFYFAGEFNGDLSNWNTSSVTNMSNMFGSAHEFNGDLSNWNTSSVTGMFAMFANTHKFNGDISNWNTSSVTTMFEMFANTGKFNGDISNWNTSSVTNMSFMFEYARVFNGDLSDWDTSSVRVTSKSLCNFQKH